MIINRFRLLNNWPPTRDNATSLFFNACAMQSPTARTLHIIITSRIKWKCLSVNSHGVDDNVRFFVFCYSIFFPCNYFRIIYCSTMPHGTTDNEQNTTIIQNDINLLERHLCPRSHFINYIIIILIRFNNKNNLKQYFSQRNRQNTIWQVSIVFIYFFLC